MWRGLLSPAGHIAWTGITATALCWAIQRRWSARATGRFLLAFVVATGLHSAWDHLASLAGYAVLAALNLALLVYATHRAQVGAATLGPRQSVVAGPTPDATLEPSADGGQG